MVYESDFYTTRRPYSRPTVTSYSVTVRILTLVIQTLQEYITDLFEIISIIGYYTITNLNVAKRIVQEHTPIA
jgi:hypothetical protein